MFGHFPELLIVLGIALIIFGPEKLPEIAANTGKMVRDLRNVMDDALHPVQNIMPDDFESYYYESMRRSGEDVSGTEDEDEEPDLDMATFETVRSESPVEGDDESA